MVHFVRGKQIESQNDSKKIRPTDIISKVAVGMEINHKAFGTGTVYGIDNGIIEVQFDNQIKKFQFPDIFLQGFLSVEWCDF